MEQEDEPLRAALKRKVQEEEVPNKAKLRYLERKAEKRPTEETEVDPRKRQCLSSTSALSW